MVFRMLRQLHSRAEPILKFFRSAHISAKLEHHEGPYYPGDMVHVVVTITSDKPATTDVISVTLVCLQRFWGSEAVT